MEGAIRKRRIVFVGTLVILITALHYTTGEGRLYYHLFYRDLYYLPLIMAGLWFGLRGALLTSLSATILFLPFMIMTWQHVPILDFDRVLEIVLLNAIAAVLGIITDREKASQRELAEARSLAAMGKAVAGVAHDIKTPLTAMGGFTRLVHGRLPEDDPNREKLGIVIRETGRLETMVKEMLDFSRPLHLNISNQDVTKIVESILPLVESEAINRNLSIDIEFGSVTASLECDEDRIREALLNLVTNAMQVSPEAGHVRISARQQGMRTIMDVIDQGIGIPAQIREHIFLPFFSTKSGGTGLGLAIVSKIVQAHGGHVVVLENPGGGTTFRTVLPTRQAR
jgi:signal transduction histidine kinase